MYITNKTSMTRPWKCFILIFQMPGNFWMFFGWKFTFLAKLAMFLEYEVCFREDFKKQWAVLGTIIFSNERAIQGRFCSEQGQLWRTAVVPWAWYIGVTPMAGSAHSTLPEGPQTDPTLAKKMFTSHWQKSEPERSGDVKWARPLNESTWPSPQHEHLRLSRICQER